jgi:hypothetical protein
LKTSVAKGPAESPRPFAFSKHDCHLHHAVDVREFVVRFEHGSLGGLEMKARAVLCLTAILLAAVMMPAQTTQRDFLLLDNGDKILVNFPAGSHGTIQVKSLNAKSRVDIENTAKRGFDMFIVTAKEGWKTYPGKVDGANIAITLREAQDNNKDLATSDLPFDSDAVVRIVNSAPPRIAGGDNRKRGTRCPVDGVLLDW